MLLGICVIVSFMILDIWVLKKDYTVVKYCKCYYDQIVIPGSDPGLLGPACVAAPLSSPAYFGGMSPASRAKPTARVWWSDSELANNLVTPSLSPKGELFWKNWWHADSVHTGRKFLRIVSPGAVSVCGEKDLRQNFTYRHDSSLRNDQSSSFLQSTKATSLIYCSQLWGIWRKCLPDRSER